MARRLAVSEFVSLDGVMEDPGGAEGFVHGGWSFRYPDLAGFTYKLDEVRAHDALLLGRVTYEAFAAAWPSREGEFAEKFNTMPKYVVSSTLREPAWNNTHVISLDDVARLKEQDGGDILVNGSARLVHGLYEHDLIDEWRLMVFPIVLGTGKRLFPDHAAEARGLELTELRRLDTGTVILHYRPAAS